MDRDDNRSIPDQNKPADVLADGLHKPAEISSNNLLKPTQILAEALHKPADVMAGDQISDLMYGFMSRPCEYAIVVLDGAHSVRLWNHGAETMFGYESETVLGKPCPFAVSLRGTIPGNILFSHQSTESGIWSYDTELTDKRGRRFPAHVAITVYPSRDRQECQFLIIKDTTVESHQERLRNIIIEVAHLANQPKAMIPMLDDIMHVLRHYLELPLAYLCLSDDGEKFHVASANGLAPCGMAEHCHFGSGCSEERAAGCNEACTQLMISTEPLFNHRISGCLDGTQDMHEPMSLLHVPLLSDVAILGVLHVVIPDRLLKTYLEDSQVLSLIANKMTSSIRNKQLEKALHDYAEDLERIVQMRTDQLREKDAQLVQSGKLATLGEMATGVAHEINQPLGGISLMTQGLQKAMEKGKLTDEILRTRLVSMQEQIERINKIINHLRTFGRQAPESKSPININKPLRDVLELIGMQLQNHNIEVGLMLDESLPDVLADANRLEQVFLNIVGNARDALEEQEIKVDALRNAPEVPEWTQGWSKQIRIRSWLEEGSVKVSITDTAGGIPDKVYNKIFEPFFTTKQVGKGTGLGLSITYGIIKEFGGEVLVDTKLDKGTTFTIVIPAILPAGEERPQEP